MSSQLEKKEPYAFWLVRQFLEQDEDPLTTEGLSDRELYSTFALIVITLAILALTVGPYSMLK